MNNKKLVETIYRKKEVMDFENNVLDTLNYYLELKEIQFNSKEENKKILNDFDCVLNMMINFDFEEENSFEKKINLYSEIFNALLNVSKMKINAAEELKKTKEFLESLCNSFACYRNYLNK